MKRKRKKRKRKLKLVLDAGKIWRLDVYPKRLIVSDVLAVQAGLRAKLTPRELQVLRAELGDLDSTTKPQEHAANLGMALNTYKFHKANMYRKFKVTRKAALLAIFTKEYK